MEGLSLRQTSSPRRVVFGGLAILNACRHVLMIRHLPFTLETQVRLLGSTPDHEQCLKADFSIF